MAAKKHVFLFVLDSQTIDNLTKIILKSELYLIDLTGKRLKHFSINSDFRRGLLDIIIADTLHDTLLPTKGILFLKNNSV